MLEMHFIYLCFKIRIDLWKVFLFPQENVENQFIRIKYPTPSKKKNLRMNSLKFVLLDDDRIYCETIKE